MMIIDAIVNQSGEKFRSEYCTAHPLSGITTGDAFVPMYSSVFANKDPLNAESDLSYSIPVSRKRSRDFSSVCNGSNSDWIPVNRCNTVTFLREDVSSQICQQQLEIDQFVALHTEKVRRELEEKRRRTSMKLISAFEESVTQRLIAKEEEIAKMTKLNNALEDKIKSLCIENQIWQELAQTNEATANALRSNLKQILEQVVTGDCLRHNTTEDDVVAVADDAQSCCASNNDNNERMLAEQDSGNGNGNMKRLCKRCGEAESCVLLLPCRHLCLCTVCVSCVDICPICKSAKNISVHVHLS